MPTDRFLSLVVVCAAGIAFVFSGHLVVWTTLLACVGWVGPEDDTVRWTSFVDTAVELDVLAPLQPGAQSS